MYTTELCIYGITTVSYTHLDVYKRQVAACVIGGTSFAGGVATIPGVLMGIFIIGFIYNGMNLIGVSSYYQSMTKGAVIIGAVMLDMIMNKKNR